MTSPSVWAETMTFFSLLRQHLTQFSKEQGSICVVGAADGKFVLPLASDGWHVTAIERDQTAVHGGEVEFPEGKGKMDGLLTRLDAAGLRRGVEVIDRDFLDLQLDEQCLATFTSCSWHYSINHGVPLEKFIKSMQYTVMPGGVFCAEYMMPCEERHYDIEHYVREGQLRQYFTEGWNIVLEFYTEPFAERAHVGNLQDHMHRMGFLLAEKVVAGF